MNNSMTFSICHEKRPCFVKHHGETVRALFHMFAEKQYVKDAILVGETSGQFSYPVAVVEFDTGEVAAVDIDAVNFQVDDEYFDSFFEKEPLEIKVRVLRDTVQLPEKIEQGDWIDLQLSEDVHLSEGESTLLPLGVCIELPRGYEALLVPRSSTFSKFGIVQSNSVGVVDESYCGDEDEWLMPVYATRDVHIRAGTRICQFRVFKHMPEVEIEQVKYMMKPSRHGCGSTGD